MPLGSARDTGRERGTRARFVRARSSPPSLAGTGWAAQAPANERTSKQRGEGGGRVGQRVLLLLRPRRARGVLQHQRPVVEHQGLLRAARLRAVHVLRHDGDEVARGGVHLVGKGLLLLLLLLLLRVQRAGVAAAGALGQRAVGLQLQQRLLVLVRVRRVVAAREQVQVLLLVLLLLLQQLVQQRLLLLLLRQRQPAAAAAARRQRRAQLLLLLLLLLLVLQLGVLLLRGVLLLQAPQQRLLRLALLLHQRAGHAARGQAHELHAAARRRRHGRRHAGTRAAADQALGAQQGAAHAAGRTGQLGIARAQRAALLLLLLLLLQEDLLVVRAGAEDDARHAAAAARRQAAVLRVLLRRVRRLRVGDRRAARAAVAGVGVGRRCCGVDGRRGERAGAERGVHAAQKGGRGVVRGRGGDVAAHASLVLLLLLLLLQQRGRGVRAGGLQAARSVQLRQRPAVARLRVAGRLAEVEGGHAGQHGGVADAREVLAAPAAAGAGALRVGVRDALLVRHQVREGGGVRRQGARVGGGKDGGRQLGARRGAVRAVLLLLLLGVLLLEVHDEVSGGGEGVELRVAGAGRAAVADRLHLQQQR